MNDLVGVSLAYIDPGSGSLLLQFMIAGLIGGLAFFRHQFVSMISWIRTRTSSRKS